MDRRIFLVLFAFHLLLSAVSAVTIQQLLLEHAVWERSGLEPDFYQWPNAASCLEQLDDVYN
jgi:hypothetical protein